MLCLNTREAEGAAELTRRLKALGAEVLERPMIRFAPPPAWAPFDARLDDLRAGDWIAFTSVTAVRCSLARMKTLGVLPEKLSSAALVAVGPATAAALSSAGLPPALVPERFQAEPLLQALLARLEPGARVWLPRAAKGREVVAEGLAEAGFSVAVTPVYRTVMPEGGLGPAARPLADGKVDWVFFTSPSTVENFMAMAAAHGWQPSPGGPPRVACLGTVTAGAARRNGLLVAVTADPQHLGGLMASLLREVERQAAGGEGVRRAARQQLVF